jgi:TRAP-type C4-dicarboxylate transport system substrate-binding protein
MNYTADKKPSGKPVELVIHNIHDHGTEIMDMWMKEVVTRTGGGVGFKKTTGEDRGAIQAADIVRDVPAGGERYRLLNLIQIPFIFPTATVGSRVVAQMYAEFPEMRKELDDVKVLGLGTGAPLAIFSSKYWGPVRSLENFKDARTRSMPQIDKVIEAFGAKPRHVGWFEMPQLLKSGELDAAVLGVLPGHQFKLEEGAAPNCTLTGDLSITMHPMRIYMKPASWERLPADIQKTIEGIGPAGADCWYALENGRDSDTSFNKALENISSRGRLIKITEKEMERWRALARPEREAAVNAVEAAGLPGKRFFKRMNELVKEYS